MEHEFEVNTDSEEESENGEDIFHDVIENPEHEQALAINNESRNENDQVCDPALVSEHSYLGNNMEIVQGRTLLDEGSIIDLPIFTQLGLVGVPGQTMPLAINRLQTISMLKNVISGNHIFGIVSFRHDEIHVPFWDKIGTTAEIYEYGESELDSVFRVKAKVRQRFKVISTRRQVDGNVIGTVEILSEKMLTDALHYSRVASLDRHRFPPGVGGNLSDCRALVQKRMFKKQMKVPYTIWPSWVYKSYDLEILSERVRCELQKSIFVSSSKSSDGSSGTVLPQDAVDLSYWVIKNLTLEDHQRIQLLSINNPNQRLRAELSILEQCESLCCRECSHVCAKQSDVFAMSKEGPQGAYVNPFGHVHETLTVHKVDGIEVTTQPSAEFSWFPGYAWSICECKYCLNHMGWLFTATNRQLEPQRFWGLCRGSLKPKLKTGQDGRFLLVL